MRTDKKPPQKVDKKAPSRAPKRGVVGYSKKSALLEEAITHMNAGKYGRSSASLKELLGLDPHNTEARRLFATLHLRLGSLVTARQAFESLANEAIGRQDFWLAESLLREYLAAGPRCVPFLELLAHVYGEKGDAMAAVAELGKAIDILIENPDSENPKKPSQLYAKVRELAPASAVAFQFASLFDIRTGDYLGHPPVVSAEAAISDADALKASDEVPAAIEDSSASEVMPWEQFDSPPASPAIPPPTSANPVIESAAVSEVLIDQAPAPQASPELPPPPSESAEPVSAADSLVQDTAPQMLNVASSFEEASATPMSDDPLLLSPEHRDEANEESISEGSSLKDEELSSSEELTTDVGTSISAPVGSQGLSAPMPWEQIEHATIKIEEATQSAPPPLLNQSRHHNLALNPFSPGPPTPSLRLAQTSQPVSCWLQSCRD